MDLIGWMMEYKLITPSVFAMYTNTETEAKVAARTMEGMLQLLGTQHRVLIRRYPEYHEDKEFGSDASRWLSTCRFMIVEGPPELVYNDNNSSR